MTAIEKATTNLLLSTFDQDAVMRHLNLNPRDPATQALLLVCQKYDLDPILKHALLIKGRLYVTRDGLLHVAHRSGVFDGMEVIDQGSDQTHFTAKVSVWRKDMGRPFSYIGRYPKTGQIAKDFGPEMAVKVAEVMALRRAFDVALGAAEERWDEEAQADLTARTTESAAPQQGARRADVTREIQQAAGTPAHTTQPAPQAPNATALQRVRDMAQRVQQYGAERVEEILGRHDWQSDMSAAAAAYSDLKDFGLEQAALLKAREQAQPAPQEDVQDAQFTPDPTPITNDQIGQLQSAAKGMNADSSEIRAAVWAWILQRPEPVNTTVLTAQDAADVLAYLAKCSPEQRIQATAEAMRVFDIPELPF